MMKKQKAPYEAPEAEQLFMAQEGMICASGVQDEYEGIVW